MQRGSAKIAPRRGRREQVDSELQCIIETQGIKTRGAGRACLCHDLDARSGAERDVIMDSMRF